MPHFVHPALLWGLPIVGVPVVIHLINMMRHRRVEWAAMEFLLASQKKNRTWVMLKQLLLLLARITAVALVVLMVAQPLLRNELGSFFRASRTHHIVLLDDSFSMSDRWADTSAFEQAKSVIERIGAEAARQTRPQTFTLLRFSRARSVSAGTHPDMMDEPVDADFLPRLRDTLKPLAVSHAAVGPTAALEAIKRLLTRAGGENRIVYLVTDFRARQWGRPRGLRRSLVELNKSGARLELINCVDTPRPNLALTGLAPGKGNRVAGVPLFMEVTVKNFGTAPVKDVPVLLEADGQSRPAVKIARIPPGQAVKERFPVRFSAPGEHSITARLDTDVVEVDNFRYRVVEFLADLPVLVVDGGADALDARYVSAALAPGGPVVTGVSPRIETPRYLSLNPLKPFRAIYLLNIERLDRSAIQALEQYLTGGGGVGVFLGERSRADFINEALYRAGDGFFPAPLAGQAELLVDRLQKAPDLDVGDHSMFRVFRGRRNSFLSTVIVQRYFAVPKDWRPKPDSGTEVIARLRNGAPLVIERRFGEGRVVAVLTTAAPVWNNWARGNPSFIVAMLELQGYLSGDSAGGDSLLVGAPLELHLDAAKYETPVHFVTPGREAAPGATVNAVVAPDGSLVASLPATETSGLYRADVTPKAGGTQSRRWAVNVDPQESDLKVVGGPELAARLEGVKYRYEQAAMYHDSLEDLAGYNLGEALLYALVLLLIGEQVLAFSASYHPRSRQPRRAGGGGP